jgi:hypothetical protein
MVKSKGISRRQFLSQLGKGAGIVFLGSKLSGCATTQPVLIQNRSLTGKQDPWAVPEGFPSTTKKLSTKYPGSARETLESIPDIRRIELAIIKPSKSAGVIYDATERKTSTIRAQWVNWRVRSSGKSFLHNHTYSQENMRKSSRPLAYPSPVELRGYIQGLLHEKKAHVEHVATVSIGGKIMGYISYKATKKLQGNTEKVDEIRKRIQDIELRWDSAKKIDDPLESFILVQRELTKYIELMKELKKNNYLVLRITPLINESNKKKYHFNGISFVEA